MISILSKTELQKFISDHLNDDPAQLMLKAGQYPDWPMKQIVEQIQSKRKAKSKLPGWFQSTGIIYPSLLSMEQCSSEQTANYKAGIITEGKKMVDLTGGFGVDFGILSKKFEEGYYVEQQPDLVTLARHNFAALGLVNVKIHQSKSSDFLKGQGHFDLIYMDPARRNKEKQKVVRLEDYEPNVIDLLPVILKNSECVLLKTSPLLDIKRAVGQLKHVSEVHIVAVNNEVKELLFKLRSSTCTNPTIICSNLHNDLADTFSFDYDYEEGITVAFGEVDQYLYEPNASIMKAGAFKAIAKKFSLTKLHSNSHLYTSKHIVDGFPGRVFRVEDTLTLNKKYLKKYLPEMKANITVRNFPMSVRQIREKTGIKEGGEHYIFATQTLQGKQVILCRKPD